MIYARGGYIIKPALRDKDFDAVKEHLPFMEIKNTAVREHVSEIERELRQVKERVRSTSSKFPFQFIPTMALMYTV